MSLLVLFPKVQALFLNSLSFSRSFNIFELVLSSGDGELLI